MNIILLVGNCVRVIFVVIQKYPKEKSRQAAEHMHNAYTFRSE